MREPDPFRVDRREPTTLAERVQSRLDALGLGPTTAAQAAGLQPTYVRDILREKKHRLTGEGAVALARILECDVVWLVSGEESPEVEQLKKPFPSSAGRSRTVPPDDSPAGRVPILGTQRGDVAGSFIITDEIIDWSPPPPGLAHALNLYALYVPVSSMEPQHGVGELRFISPHRPIVHGDSVVLFMEKTASAAPYCLLRQYWEEEEGETRFVQLNPLKEEALSIRSITMMHRVMTTAELFGL